MHKKPNIFLSPLLIATLASILSGFNARLAIVGYPVILKSLNIDIWKMIWVLQGYMLGSTIPQLLIGSLSDVRGRKNIFMTGIAMFVIGGALSGVSFDFYILALSRLIQGIGGGIMMSIGLVIVSDNVPNNKLTSWIGINQMGWRVGALFGLSLSGLLIDKLGWRSIFLVQVPFGLVLFYLSKKHLEEKYVPMKNVKVDVTKAVIFMLILGLFLLSITFHGYGHSNLLKYLMLTMPPSLLILIYKIYREKENKVANALLRNHLFLSSIIAQFLYSLGFGATPILISLLLETVYGYTPTKTGISLIPFELSFLIFGVLGGRLGDIYRKEILASIGLFLSSLSLILLSSVHMSVNVRYILLSQIIFGIGTGLFVAPNTSMIISSVSNYERGIASSLRSLSFNIGYILSLNVAILSMTSSLPYDIATSLIRGIHVEDYSSYDLHFALCNSFRVLSMVFAIAIPLSLIRIFIKR